MSEISLPTSVTVDQIIKLVDVVAPKIKGVSQDEIKRIASDLTESVVNAALFVGLIDDNNGMVVLTERGRTFSSAEGDDEKSSVLWRATKKIPIYDQTLEFLHHGQHEKPTRVQIGAYWNESFNVETESLNEDSLNRAVNFYLNWLDTIQIGKYVKAGRGRETHIVLDRVKLAEYITLSPEKVNRPSRLAIQSDEKRIDLDQESSAEPGLPPSGIRSGHEIDDSLPKFLRNLSTELSWQDLDSNGAKKLIVQKIHDLQNENTVLAAKVSRLAAAEIDTAVVRARIQSLSRQNYFQTAVNSIRGVIAGASLALPSVTTQVVAAVSGLSLIILSLFVVPRRSDSEDDDV